MSGRPELRNPGADTIVDHALHGLVTIRLVGAPASALRELEFLLGPSVGNPAGEPDITITYGEGVGRRRRLRYIGLNEAAYDEDSFFLLDDQSKTASFDFGQFGEACEFACEPGTSIFRYLLPVIGLRLLRKGYLMLHAASFVFEGKGILVTGWQKGGKTEMLLSFMAAGAQYLADEWTILSPTEGKMWGVPGTLQIWDWHLRSLPEYWGRIRPEERTRLQLLRLYQRAYRYFPRQLRGRGLVGKWLERLSLDGGVALVGQARTTPQRMFGRRFYRGPSQIDAVFLAGAGEEIALSPAEPSEIADRMVASLAFERRSLMARYLQFQFAFPDRKNEFLETAGDREREYLRRALHRTPSFEIVHPYPVPLKDLFSSCAPAVRQVGTGRYDNIPLDQGEDSYEDSSRNGRTAAQS